MAVPLTNAQKYRRGLLPQLTSPSDTRIRYSQQSSQPVAARTTRGAAGGAGSQAQSYASSAPQQGWADYYQGPMIDIGGDVGDWGGMIGGDYEVQGMESMMNARMGRARGDFQSQIRQALVDLGITDRAKLGNLGQYIDEDTISNAAANKYSRTAQIAQQENRMRAQSEADLAARGMLSSGQLTQNAENILAEGEQGRYSALRDFLGAGQQGLTQIADLQDQMSMQLAQARANAAARAAETYWRQQEMNRGRIRGVTDSSGRNPGDPGYMAPGLWDPGYVGTNPVGAVGAQGQQAAGVQDLINQGVIPWDQGMGDIGYSKPPWMQ